MIKKGHIVKLFKELSYLEEETLNNIKHFRLFLMGVKYQ